MADRILRLKDVIERTGLCRSHVYGLEGFPRAVKLGTSRAVGWSETAVDEWIAETLQAAGVGSSEGSARRN